MATEVLVTVTVAVDVERYPVPKADFKHLLAEVIASLAALLSDDLPEVAIDRIAPSDSEKPLRENLMHAMHTWPPTP